MKFVGINTVRMSNGQLKQYAISDKGIVLFRWFDGQDWGPWVLESSIDFYETRGDDGKIIKVKV